MIRDDYHRAYSALRWLRTYDPGWDYWHRNYPRFDNRRDADKELMSVHVTALGGAYKSLEWSDYYSPYKPNRYLERQQERKRVVRRKYRVVAIEYEYGDGRKETVAPA